MTISRPVVSTIWYLFVETGDVQSNMGKRAAPPANLIIDHRADLELIDILISAPEATLHEHLATFEAETGLSVHISTFCQAVRRLGFTRRKVCAPLSLLSRYELPQSDVLTLPRLNAAFVPAPAACPWARRSRGEALSCEGAAPENHSRHDPSCRRDVEGRAIDAPFLWLCSARAWLLSDWEERVAPSWTARLISVLL
jgi:hypothetical protein